MNIDSLNIAEAQAVVLEGMSLLAIFLTGVALLMFKVCGLKKIWKLMQRP